MGLMLFILCNIFNGLTLSHLGCSVDSLEYWIGMFCICGAYVGGRIQESKR